MTEKLHERAFLNSENGLAAYELSIDSIDGKQGTIYISLGISDCNRKVYLEFDVYSKEGEDSREDRLHKVRVLKSALQKIEDSITSLSEML